LLYLLNYGIWVPYHWLSAAILARLVDPTKVPAHIAVIMDGNRRFAHSIGLPSIKLGHEQGAEKLREFLEWCLRYENIREVTVCSAVVWFLALLNTFDFLFFSFYLSLTL
jgi:undecaprenyl pyrophosphate synthase